MSEVLICKDVISAKQNGDMRPLNFVDRLIRRTRYYSHSNLSAVNARLIDHTNIPYVRTQCTGNCVFIADHTFINYVLTQNQLLTNNEVVSGFLNQLKVIWYSYNHQKYQLKYDKNNNIKILESLWGQKTASAYWSAMNEKNYVFTPRNNNELKTFLWFDEFFLTDLNTRILSSQKYSQKFEDDLKLPLGEFLAIYSSEFAVKLTEKIGRQVEFHKIGSLKFALSNGFSDHEFSLVESFKNSPLENDIPEFKDKTVYKNVVLAVTKSLSQGTPVPHTFSTGLFSSKEAHRVLLTGFVIDELNYLIGFRYLDSQGEQARDNGYGFISISDYLQYNKLQQVFIDSIEINSSH